MPTRTPGRDANGNPLPAGGPAPPRPGQPPPGYVGGPGATDPGRGVDDYLFGKATYTAGFPGYRGESSYNNQMRSLEARGQQQELGNAVQDRALGRGGPSVAELQMQRGMNQAQQRLAQQAASARGMNRGSANRAAMRAGSDLYAQTNEQTGIMRAQEQIAAQQLAAQNTRDMRAQDLIARGHSIDEAKAIMDAEIRVQDINAQTARGNAVNAQGPTMMGIGALGGALGALSDERAKDIMYSDFTTKEDPLRPDPARTTMLAEPAPEPQVRAAGGYQPMLTVTPTADLTKSAEEQQRSLGEQAMNSAMNSGGGSNAAQSAATGFQIGSALGGLLSDFTTKEMGKARPSSMKLFDTSPERIDRMGRFEVEDAKRRFKDRESRSKAEDLWRYRRDSARLIDERLSASDDSREMYASVPSDFRSKEMAELDQVGRDAMLPFEQMNEAESREALAPVDPVIYRYKEGPSMRMADEQAGMADLRARYAGMGGAAPEEADAIRRGTFEDKRTPRLGIVAQDLQQSPAFRNSVVSTPAGLAVQRDRALSTALGSLAGIDKRMRRLEDSERGRLQQRYANEIADEGDGDAAAFDEDERNARISKRDRARLYLRSQVAPRVEFSRTRRDALGRDVEDTRL